MPKNSLCLFSIGYGAYRASDERVCKKNRHPPDGGTDGRTEREVPQRIVGYFLRRVLLDKADGETMRRCAQDGGFSLDAGVRIEANNRTGLERLLRYCARPAFAQERLQLIDAAHLVYESPKPGPGGRVSLMLTPLELIERLAALIPPPRRHRHHDYEVLVPNALLQSQLRPVSAEE